MKTYIINLPDRPERLAQAKQELESHGIKEYEVYPAIKHENGKLGIYLTLYKLIEESYFNEEQFIRIFEDDVRFLKDEEYNNPVFGLIDDIQRNASTRDFDIYYMGCNSHDPHEGRTPFAPVWSLFPAQANQNALRVLDAYGCHAMIISRQGMFKILKAINKKAEIFLLPGKFNSHHLIKELTDTRPIDVLIQQEIQPQGKCYCTNPIIATQRSGYSDIEKKEMNQDYIVDRFNQNVKNLFK